MGRPRDTDPPQSNEPSAEQRPGRVEVDARGRNVWRWNSQEGDSTSVLLERLDNKDLALEPTQKVAVVKQAAAAGPKAAPSADRQPAKALAPAAPNRAPPKAPAAAAKPSRGADRSARPPFAVEPNERDKGGGFDPYNSR